MAAFQNFPELGLPSEIHFQRDQFEKWFDTIAFTNPRTIARTAAGLLNWTKEEAFARYNEELALMEKQYKAMHKDYTRWKQIESFRVSTLQNFTQRQPGPLPPYKTRIYELGDYLERYPEENMQMLSLQRTLSYDQRALEEAMEKADECEEGDAILNNYYIPFSTFSGESTITYSFLKKIDGKMKETTQTVPLKEFNHAVFKFDTSGYVENEQFYSQICEQLQPVPV